MDFVYIALTTLGVWFSLDFLQAHLKGQKKIKRALWGLQERVEDLEVKIDLILSGLNIVGPAGVIEFYTLIDGKQRKVTQMTLKVTQTLPVSLKIVDSKGNPALVDGAPTWSVSDPTLAAVAPSPDGMSAVITPLGPMGSFTVQAACDADLGPGVTSIIGTLDIDLAGGDAVAVTIVAGTPV